MSAEMIERASALPFTTRGGLDWLPYADRDEWLRIRRTGIGSSDAGSTAGLGFDTPLELWSTKTGRAPEKDLSDQENVGLGVKLEPTVAELYEERTGRTLQRSLRVARSREHPFMLANIDRRVVGEKRLCEIKTVGFTSRGFISDDWGPDGSSVVPIRVYLQVQHQLAVHREIPVCDVAALIAGVGYRTYPIPRDDDTIAKLIKLEAAFWRKVETDEPPSISTYEEAKRAFPQHVARAVEADEETRKIAWLYQELTQRRTAINAEIDDAQMKIGAFLGEADTLTVFDTPFITWRTQTRKSYTVAESTSRVMRIVKEKKLK